MALSAIDTIALILVILSSIKLLVILINPISWKKISLSVFKNSAVTSIISLVLAAVVLYFLLQELTVVQIFSVMALMALLMVPSFAIHSKEMSKFINKVYKDKNLLKHSWLVTIIWVALIIWVLLAIFS